MTGAAADKAVEAAKTAGAIAKDLVPVVGQQPVGWALLLVGVVALLCLVALGVNQGLLGRHVLTLSRELHAMVAVNDRQAKTQEATADRLSRIGEIVAAIADRAHVVIRPAETKREAG
jgi:di/tricarboxylate transporter